MIFFADLAFAVELLAIGLGIGFIIWSMRNKGAGIQIAKITGYFILIAAVFALVCTSVCTARYWEKGYFDKPYKIMKYKKK